MTAPMTISAMGWRAGQDVWPRAWNYLAGGNDNYGPDREFVYALRAKLPQIQESAGDRLMARRRLAERLAGAWHVDQFLVLCADLPLPVRRRGPQRLALCPEALAEVHAIVQEINPDARTVYVSPDPVVAVHARALLCTSPGCVVVQAGPADPVAILDGASRALDLSRPVAVVMIGALELLDDRDATALVQAFGAVLAPGSHLAIVHLTATSHAAVTLAAICASHQVPAPHLRNPEDVAALLGGAEMTVVSGRALHARHDLAVWSATTRIGDGA